MLEMKLFVLVVIVAFISATTAQITECKNIQGSGQVVMPQECRDASPLPDGTCCDCQPNPAEDGVCSADPGNDPVCLVYTCPTTSFPTVFPTREPTESPTVSPTSGPTVESPTNTPTVLPTALEPTMEPTYVPTQQLTSTETTDVSTTDVITTFPFSTATPTPTVLTTDFEISTTEEQTQKKKQWKKSKGKKSKKYKSKSGKKYKWKSKSKSSGLRKKKYYYLGHENYGYNRGKTDKKCCECLNKQHFGGCEDRECERMICDTDPFCCYHKWDDMCAMQARAECRDELLPVCCDCSVRQRGKGCESDTLCEEMVCGKDSFCCEYKWDRRCANEATAKCKENAGHGTKQMKE